jgi:hypothetical protein
MRRPRRFFNRRRGDERGFVIVWMTVVIVLLLSVAAFAVDLVHAYVEAERAQNAADAAALAGSTLVNTSPDCGAPTDRANALAKDNGFDPAADSRVVVTPTCTGPNEMTVEVKRTFDTFFARIMGFSSLTVKRKAIAQYDAPLQMGSPTNWIGSVPTCPPGYTSCLNGPANLASGFLWASIEGDAGNKAQGNSINTHNCDPNNADECGVTATSGGAVVNKEQQNGEYFEVNVPATEAGQPLDIDAFDAGFVATQPQCTAATPVSGYAAIAPQVVANWTQPTWCTGDSSFPPNLGPITTTFQVFRPDGDTNPANNTQLAPCQGGQAPPIPGYAYDDANHDGVNQAVQESAADPLASKYFHQWQSMCHLSSDEPGDYIVHVTAHSETPTAWGSNQFGLMALHPSNLPVDNGSGALSVFSREQLPLAAVSSAAATSTFFLTRVLPSDRDRKLELSFFDLGDSSIPPFSRQGDLTLSTSENVSAAFTNALTDTTKNMCTYVPPPAAGSGSRDLDSINNFTSTPSGICSLHYDSDGVIDGHPWDSRWVKLLVDLPPMSDTNKGFNCQTSDPRSCWIMLNITPQGGGLSDATTWSAHILGGPVRLVG